MAGQGQQQPPGDALALSGPFGDLFQPHDIAAGQAAPATPSWPRWNLTRPFLNGDFLLQVLTALPILAVKTEISLHLHQGGQADNAKRHHVTHAWVA